MLATISEAFLNDARITRLKSWEYAKFYYQYFYYTSSFYNEKVRKFKEEGKEDTLYLRFEELKEKFVPIYERIWNIRA